MGRVETETARDRVDSDVGGAVGREGEMCKKIVTGNGGAL